MKLSVGTNWDTKLIDVLSNTPEVYEVYGSASATPMSSTINELIYASEYIALQGSRKIIICERGIRTFENKTRNTLDISSIPIIKIETKLPVIVDLSHSLGRKDIILQIAKAALAVGADGIMVEVHPNPQTALSDSNQQLNLLEFKNLINGLNLLIK